MWSRTLALLATATLAAASPAAALAASLDQAIEAALARNPVLRQAGAGEAAARARVTQARAAYLPSASIAASTGRGTMDLGGFFGFGREDIRPRSAQLSIEQPLFTGGAAGAGMGGARAGVDLAKAETAQARLGLAADVAETYGAVRVGDAMLSLYDAQVRQMTILADQAKRRFEAGEAPSTDVAQAQARLAGARAGYAQAQAQSVAARTRYRALVGEEPVDLEPMTGGPPSLDLDASLDQAVNSSPAIHAAEARLRAADAAVDAARAAYAPTVALTAQVSTVRDEFLPGYRSDGGSVALRARAPLFTGGLTSGRVAEAVANRTAARAGLDAARDETRAAVAAAWQAVRAADAVRIAASEQQRAAGAARDAVGHEVRTGEKPMLALLDAERELLDAQAASLRAEAAVVVTRYRLAAVVGATMAKSQAE